MPDGRCVLPHAAAARAHRAGQQRA